MSTAMTDPIIAAARDHAADRRDVLVSIAESLSPAQLADAAIDAAALAREDARRAIDVATLAQETTQRAIEDCERLAALLTAAESDAETQRAAAADRRAALDRVATAAGVGADSTASIVADRVIAAASRPALPADLRAYLETLLNRLRGGDGLAVAAEIAALTRWIALPTAEVVE